MIPLDNSLQQLEELRQAKVIMSFIEEIEEEWWTTQEEHTEIGLEATRLLLLDLVHEAVLELRGLRA
jgi:hypothetical protein